MRNVENPIAFIPNNFQRSGRESREADDSDDATYDEELLEFGEQ